MKLIHTADWHLGQTFYDYDRKQEHFAFLLWLQELIQKESVDLLLIAGDVFDSPNPSAESQHVFYTFLQKVTKENPDLQIIIIAGNHDSAARLEAPSPVLEAFNISIRGTIKRRPDNQIDFQDMIIPLKKGGYCLAVPYLRQGDYPHAETYSEGVKNMYETVFDLVKEQQGPIIAMGHLQASGAEVSENDRAERLIIGGLEYISPQSFNAAIAYTALGHLHRAQRVGGRENIRYSGTPLPMSFAEKNNTQGVVLVEIENEETKIDRIIFDSPVKLVSIPALPLAQVLDEIEALPLGEKTSKSPFLEVNVLISEPEPSLKHHIEKALENKAVRLARLYARTSQCENIVSSFSTQDVQEIDPMEMANDVFKRRYGGENLPQAMKILLKSVIEEVRL